MTPIVNMFKTLLDQQVKMTTFTKPGNHKANKTRLIINSKAKRQLLETIGEMNTLTIQTLITRNLMNNLRRLGANMKSICAKKANGSRNLAEVLIRTNKTDTQTLRIS